MNEHKLATFACRIQSRKYPEYWGFFEPWAWSNDRKQKSIGIIVSKNGRVIIRQQWWLEAKKRPTWGELYEKLDQVIEMRVERGCSI